ncbi:MAG: hypothetical protein U1G07_02665 [Verrucomicrobiota bacterium]
MKALTDYIHGKGLKAGIYTSPGPTTCAGHVGAYQHEELDVRRFVEWGFDFLKHDWCSYGNLGKGNSREELEKPYRQIAALLRQQPRDVVLNLCQYGMGNVWEWGREIGRIAGELLAISGEASKASARPCSATALMFMQKTNFIDTGDPERGTILTTSCWAI